MGITKRLQMADAEQERRRELAKLQAEADAMFPSEHWDAEDYEAFQQAMEKDD